MQEEQDGAEDSGLTARGGMERIPFPRDITIIDQARGSFKVHLRNSARMKMPRRTESRKSKVESRKPSDWDGLSSAGQGITTSRGPSMSEPAESSLSDPPGPHTGKSVKPASALDFALLQV